MLDAFLIQVLSKFAPGIFAPSIGAEDLYALASFDFGFGDEGLQLALNV